MIMLITVVHVIVSVALIAIVLLGAGKGAGLANIFGGGSSGLFTPSSGGPIAKITAGLAVLFLITSLYLSLSTRTANRSSSLLEKIVTQEQNQGNSNPVQEKPAAPQETPLQE